MPPEASRYHLEGLRLLVAICRQLQIAAGTDPYYLGCRDAGRMLGVSHQQAHRWLWRLAHDGVIEVVRAGTQGPGGRATRYRYLGDHHHDSGQSHQQDGGDAGDDPGPYGEGY